MGDSLRASGLNNFEELLREARAGSSDALGQILEMYRRYLLRLGAAAIRPELQPKGGASDLVQDTFLDAQRAFPDFRGRTRKELCAWLRTIFLRNASNFRQHYCARHKRQVAREVPWEAVRSGDPVRGPAEAARGSPDPAEVRGEQVSRLQTALAELPGLYRQVVQLHTWERQTFYTIGRQIGSSEEAVRKLWARAVKQLAKTMKDGR
jgi:RNA polymerase sigma-70 factor (ECF subfamily)